MLLTLEWVNSRLLRLILLCSASFVLVLICVWVCTGLWDTSCKKETLLIKLATTDVAHERPQPKTHADYTTFAADMFLITEGNETLMCEIVPNLVRNPAHQSSKRLQCFDPQKCIPLGRTCKFSRLSCHYWEAAVSVHTLCLTRTAHAVLHLGRELCIHMQRIDTPAFSSAHMHMCVCACLCVSLCQCLYILSFQILLSRFWDMLATWSECSELTHTIVLVCSCVCAGVFVCQCFYGVLNQLVVGATKLKCRDFQILGSLWWCHQFVRVCTVPRHW